MTWVLYDYLDDKGINEIKAWTQKLQKKERAKLNAKLDMLEKHGSDLPPGLLSDTKFSHIKEIVIKGQVAVRLMVCRGPIDNNKEFTLLFGAIEKDRKYIPRDALQQAETRRQKIIKAQKKWKEVIKGREIVKTPNSRRCLHERVGE